MPGGLERLSRLVHPFERPSGTCQLFPPLLEALAVYAERCDRSGHEPAFGDLPPALLADAERAVVDSVESFPDLENEFSFPVPDAKEEISVCFQGGPVGGVGEKRLFVGHAVERERGVLDQPLEFFMEALPELFLLLFVHGSSPEPQVRLD